MVFAILIDAGYVTDWPHIWTRQGARAVRRHKLEDGGYNGNRVLEEAYRRRPPGAALLVNTLAEGGRAGVPL